MAGAGTTRVAQGGTLILNGISSLDHGPRAREPRADRRRAAPRRCSTTSTTRRSASRTSARSARPRARARRSARRCTTPAWSTARSASCGSRTARAEPDTGTFTGTDAANRVVLVGERTFTGAVQLPGTIEIADDLTVKAGDTLTVAGTAIQRAGTLRGNVTVTGRLTWDGGRQSGPGTTTVAAGRADRGHAAARRSAAARPRSTTAARSSSPACCGSRRAPTWAPSASSGRRSPTAAGSSSTPRTTTRAAPRRASTATRCCSTRARSPRPAARAASHLRLLVDNDGTINGPLELESDSTVTHTGTFKDVTLGDGVLVDRRAARRCPARPRSPAASCACCGPVTVAALKQTGGLISAGTLTVTGQFAWTDGDQAGPGRDRARRGRHRRRSATTSGSTRTASCATPAR